MEVYIWLGLFIVLLLVELFTVGLTTIWFAAGAVISLILAACGVSLPAQIIAFVLISIVLLIFTRPLAMKYVNNRRVKTNYESLIGKTAKVTMDISNEDETGAAFIDGKTWTARAVSQGEKITQGTLVRVVEIQGVKLVVEKLA